jgi:hypothetical protein
MDCAGKTSGRGGPHGAASARVSTAAQDETGQVRQLGGAASARVSTAAQDETGQVRQLGAAGCEKVFREKITGTTADRPQKLLNTRSN